MGAGVKGTKRSIHPSVLTELEGCGLPWHLEPGSKHNKLYIDGRFCDVLPHDIKHPPPRMEKKIRAHVRRFVRQIKEGENASSPNYSSA